MISIISPVYNEADNLIDLYERIKNVLNKIQEDFEVILVENGSSDNSLEDHKKNKKKKTQESNT